MDVRHDGCGGRLFGMPVHPEVVGEDCRPWERTPERIAVLRLNFGIVETGREAVERMLAGLKISNPISFEAIGTHTGIVHQIVCQLNQRNLIDDRLRSEFKGVVVEEIKPRTDSFHSFLEPLRRQKQRPAFAFRAFYLPAPFYFHLGRTGTGSGGIYEVLSRVGGQKECLAMWQVVLVPTRRRWIQAAQSYLGEVDIGTRQSRSTGNTVEVRSHPDLSADQLSRHAQELRQKTGSRLFAVCLRICAFGYGKTEAQLIRGLEGCLDGFRHGDGEGLRSLSGQEYDAHGLNWEEQLFMLRNRVTFSGGMILSAEELAGLLPIPPLRVLDDDSYLMARARTTRAVPGYLTKEGVMIGTNSHLGRKRPVRLPETIREQHVYTVGKTCMGKSTTIINVVHQHMQRGDGLTVFDTEGDLVEEILKVVPSSRIRDVLLFDVGDTDYAPAFNVLDSRAGRSKARRVNDFLETFEVIAGAMGERMKRLLVKTLNALAEVRGCSLDDVAPFLSDPNFRRVVVSKVRDVRTRRYWLQEFPAEEQTSKLSIDALKTRVEKITEDELARAVTCQRENKIDLTKVLRGKQILLVNLNFPGVGATVGSMLGQLLMAELQAAVMSHKLGSRTTHYIFCDEFQNYRCAAFEQLFSRGGKFGARMWLAHQFRHQIGELIRPITGNAGAKIVFRLGEKDDVSAMARMLNVDPREIETIPKLDAWVMIDNARFTMRRTDPPKLEVRHDAEIIERCRAQYATKRSEIDYAPAFLPGYFSAPIAAGDGRAKQGPIDIDESFDELK